MKFDLHINQKAILENGFDLDLVDGAILDYCLKFSRAEAIQTLPDEGTTYYWFQHENVCEQLPLLRMKPDTMYRRMKILCDKSFLQAHPKNKQKGQSWYALCPNAYLIESTIGSKSDAPSDQNPMTTDQNPMVREHEPEPSDFDPMVPQNSPENSQNEGQPSDLDPMPIGSRSDAPSDQNPMYKYISDKSISDTNSNKDDVDVENARATADSSFEHLGAEKPPTPPSSGPPPAAPKKPIYGDGVLQHDVRQYYRDNPDKYPTEMVPAFLDWYTEIMQNSLRNRESDIGKERWRTLDTWNLRKKLDKWHTNFLNDKRKADESATAQKNTQPVSNSPRRSSGPAVGSSPATKRAATVKPGMFDRDGPPSRNTHSDSGLTTIRIDVDPDHQTAGDQT